ncbi:MAG TPA: hypothetical protein VGN12_08250 [Pirellulales bacterium]|jgi:hypothetical protein
MSGKKLGFALAIILMLAGGAGAYYAFRTDPNLALVKDLGKQMRNEDLSREDRGKLFGQMREAMDQLSEDQRRDLRREFEKGRGQRDQQKMNEFFALSKKDQTKALDKDIDEMVKRRKDWEKRQKERDAERAKQQAAGGGGTNGGQGGGQGGGGRGGPGGGGGGGDRSQQRRSALDNSSASSQAQRSEYRRQVATRMQQRGIPQTGGFGGPGGGRRGP